MDYLSNCPITYFIKLELKNLYPMLRNECMYQTNQRDTLFGLRNKKSEKLELGLVILVKFLAFVYGRQYTT